VIQSDLNIRKALVDELIRISPLSLGCIGPASIDLHLDGHFNFPDGNPKGGLADAHIPRGYVFSIPPLTFVLATTIEVVSVSRNFAAQLSGRSSVGRLGLFTENAGFIDPGFSGQITLELFNARSTPVDVTVGMRCCQLALFRLETPAATDYSERQGSKYQGQTGATPSRIDDDPENLQQYRNLALGLRGGTSL
jgi:dCTP deaminase